MGSRGAFIDVDEKDFRFKDNGQTYSIVGEIEGVKVLKKSTKGSVNAPLLSHTENRVYATLQEGKLKHLTYYGEDHKQIKSIDFGHQHGSDKLQPHVHFGNDHSKDAYYRGINDEEKDLADKIRRKYGVKSYEKK